MSYMTKNFSYSLPLLSNQTLPSTTSAPSATSASSSGAGASQTSRPWDTLSKVGAFNGTGMITMDPVDNDSQLLLFFQHFDGDLRLSELRGNSWRGGGADYSIGARNPANGTAIAGTSYMHQGVRYVSGLECLEW